MKRRVVSFITVLAMCLSLCPMRALADGWEQDGGRCPHHGVHTLECGYVPPTPGRNCTHEHDESCFITETLCVHQHTEDCYPEPGPDASADSEAEPSLCAHECGAEGDRDTLTPACSHVHDEFCGYAPEDGGAPCAFVCRICPIEDLIGKLPRSAAPDSRDQVEEQISAILALYTELTEEEQEQVDLSRCFELQAQLNAANAPMPVDAVRWNKIYLDDNRSHTAPYLVNTPTIYDTREYSLMAANTSAFQVEGPYTLDLRGSGVVESGGGAGVEVFPGGRLCVSAPDLTITGSTYALDIASGAAAELSGGTYTGNTAAIRTAGSFADLLKSGYAYFDAGGNPICPDAVAGEKTVVVKACTDHLYDYTHNPGTPAHSWTCAACGATGTEPCTFSFDKDGAAECSSCHRKIKIAVDERSLGDLIYDSTIQPARVVLTVQLDDSSTPLSEGTDYTVSCTTRVDVGEITVTVEGVTYNGTFTKTYPVTQDQPVIKWDTDVSIPVEVNYDGSPVEKGDLPNVTINIKSQNEDLSKYLQYSYSKDDINYTDGLPTNAGTYYIVASLPEMTNFHAASSAEITLVIEKISPIITAPEAIKLYYNGAEQELVTAGTVRDGAVIEYATAENGTYSTVIPTGVTVQDYTVWYQVAETENYCGVKGQVAKTTSGPRINHREVTPRVELLYDTCVYDGGEKRPTVTVRDGETIIPSSEYEVNYANNTNVGTAVVTVKNAANGNYKIAEPVTVNFKITAPPQAGLSITGQPNTVTYGDKFTLSASGGSGNGSITWEITAGKDVAEVDKNSGQVKITGVGSATVKATKSGIDGDETDPNYKEAVATWTFTAGRKPVIATVTAEDKPYDKTQDATVHAVVAQGVLDGDEITITGLTGTFDDANAGMNKTVTVDRSKAEISGADYYSVTYSSTEVKASITKALTQVTVHPAKKTPTYNGTKHSLVGAGTAGPVNEGIANPDEVSLEYALNKDGPYSPAIPEAVNAGDYEVWYRVRETDNFAGTDAIKKDVTIDKKTVTPTVSLKESSYVYDGTAKKPAVTVVDEKGQEIPAAEYTVSYSSNINVGDAAKVTVTANADGNYKFNNGAVTENFEIREGKAELTNSPQAKNLTYSGDPQELVTVGTAANGKVVYLGNDNQYTPSIPTGTDAGTYTVTYKVQGNTGYADTAAQSVQVTIQPKPVINPVVKLAGSENYTVEYTGSEQTPAVTVEDGSKEIDQTEYEYRYSNNTNAGTATVTIRSKNGSNYVINDTATFEIRKAPAEFDKAPRGEDGLYYNGTAQKLVKAGTSSHGRVVYALDGGAYSPTIPTGTKRGSYLVLAKVEGDANHEDSKPVEIPVTIDKNNVTKPTIELTSSSFTYNGSEQKPTITVKDDDGNPILANEYEVKYDGDTVNAGSYDIIISSKGNNYTFAADPSKFTRTVKILPANQTVLSITGKPNIVYCGDTLQLGTTGGSGSGTVSWSIESGGELVEEGLSDGQFKIKGVGSITIKAVRTPAKGSNYAEVEDTWQFYAYRRPVTAVVTAKDKPYDENDNAKLTVTVPGTDITIDGVTGTFDTPDVGTNKTVTINHDSAEITDGDNYVISFPDTTTASITPVDAKVDGVTGNINLTYNGDQQELVIPGTAKGGDLVYSLNGVDGYSRNIPKGRNAGEYTVWYKVLADGNHKDSTPRPVNAKIAKADTLITVPPKVTGTLIAGNELNELGLSGGLANVPGSFAWTNGSFVPDLGESDQEVTFTPDDTVNYNTSKIEVTVTVVSSVETNNGSGSETGDESGSETGSGSDSETGGESGGETESGSDSETGGETESGSGSGTESGDTSSGGGSDTNTNSTPATNEPGAVSAPIQTSVQNGTATTVLNAAAGSQLVNEAVMNQSETVVIKPEVTADVTKANVSIPTSTVSQLGSRTNAALMVSTPIADVTIPNAALGTLSSAGGAVNVATEQVDNRVSLTLTAGGRELESIPGGVTLTVPVEDAGPGTVAVLVREDGTRETIRKAVPGDGEIDIPLNGSATVEIVDNSKEFTDVAATSWEADAVAFASAHELFNGTSETTFSPEQPMSRAMLTTVLYNLEGHPDQGLASEFSDVSGDAWYAESVAWAAANGITNGYSDDRFGPNDNVTREQFAVMLWKYAGSPASDGEALNFTDADQVSDYAEEALRWASANGILNGHSNGRLDPGGPATRAQAAQMLKNFMENT